MAESAKTGNEEFGDRLRRAREALRMSRRDLADATGLSYPYVSQIETGYRMPSAPAMRSLADALGLRPESLFDAIPPAAPRDAGRAVQPAALFEPRTTASAPAVPHPLRARARAVSPDRWRAGRGRWRGGRRRRIHRGRLDAEPALRPAGLCAGRRHRAAGGRGGGTRPAGSGGRRRHRTADRAAASAAVGGAGPGAVPGGAISDRGRARRSLAVMPTATAAVTRRSVRAEEDPAAADGRCPR